MNRPVKPEDVWRNKPVYLKLALPTNRAFGNKNIIPEGAKGYVVSNGFEKGMLRVLFDLYVGKERVHFNELSARNYLVSDIALSKPMYS